MPSCPYVNWSGISSWPDSRFQVARPTFSSASYGDKNSISIDAVYGLIRRHVLTPANLHASQMLPALLDGKNADAMVWADSAYQSKRMDSFLKEAGYESRIQEKGSRHDPLATAAKERNRERSKTRSKVEHVFGQMEMVMGGKLTRCIGLARVEG